MNRSAKLTIIAALIISTGLSISLGKEQGARRAAKNANIQPAAHRAEALEAAKAKRVEKRGSIEGKKAEAKEAREAIKEKIADRATDRTEARQEHQAKRIEGGIKRGYLTPDEISKLDSQQKSIETLQQSFAADGKVTKVEANQLRKELNEASLCIFAEKHDADGNTKPVFRLGKNVILKDDVAQKLGAESLSKSDARAFLKDFHRMMELKKTLSGSISDTDRASMQTEYDNLLNMYFESK